MKGIFKSSGYILLPSLGLLWVFGCSTSPIDSGNGGTEPPPQYALILSVEPSSVYADTGTGIVSCFLTSGGQPVEGKPLNFYTYSPDSISSITSASISLSTSPTGTQWTVYYHPNQFSGNTDTIYATAFEDLGGDSIAWNSTAVTIIHP